VSSMWPNPQKSAGPLAGLVSVPCINGNMPLLFFLAGSACWHSLQLRSPARYPAGERLAAVACSPAGWHSVAGASTGLSARAAGHGIEPENYLQFYPTFLMEIRPVGHFEWAHLWFLAYLLVVALLCLPVLVMLQHDRSHGRSFTR